MTTSPSCRSYSHNTDGSLDSNFGTGGKTTTTFGGSSSAVGVVIQGDGKILVAGTSFVTVPLPASANFVLARYNPNGSLDTGFGTGGTVTTAFGAAEAIALQPDGRIVLAGSPDEVHDRIENAYLGVPAPQQ